MIDVFQMSEVMNEFLSSLLVEFIGLDEVGSFISFLFVFFLQ